MTNREETEKIRERHPPPRQEWHDLAEGHAAPSETALAAVIPLLGFALTIMLVLSFAMVLQGASPGIPMPGHHDAPRHPMGKTGRAAIFVP